MSPTRPSPNLPNGAGQARTKKTKFLFLSSTASVTGTPPSSYPISEQISHSPEDASPLGYSRSKWVAEKICDNFHKQQSHTRAVDVRVLRIGQLTADTENGIWNMTEAWPLMLLTAPFLHALPDIEQALDWLPVDTAAKAVLEIAAAMGPQPRALSNEMGDEMSGKVQDECPIYHILNQHCTPPWRDLCNIIALRSPHLELQVLPPTKWLKKLEGLEVEHPAKKLVGLWKEAFGSNKSAGEGKHEGWETKEGKDQEMKMAFAMQKTYAMSRAMKDVQPLSEAEMARMWEWVEAQSSSY